MTTKTTHSDKAMQTLTLMNTVGADWKHPVVKWVEEKVRVPGRVTCPDCQGTRRAFYTPEQAALPYDFQEGLESTAPAAFCWPHVDIEFVYTHGARTMLKDGFYIGHGLQADARRQYAAQYGVVEQDCRRCYGYAKRTWCGKPHGRPFVASHGTVPAMVEKTMLVGYIQWPEGTVFGASRFAGAGWNAKSATNCQLCGKGINKSGRVPLVTTKDGQPRAMWVGQDCARKFTGVMPAAPEQDKKKKLDVILADNVGN